MRDHLRDKLIRMLKLNSRETHIYIVENELDFDLDRRLKFFTYRNILVNDIVKLLTRVIYQQLTTELYPNHIHGLYDEIKEYITKPVVEILVLEVVYVSNHIQLEETIIATISNAISTIVDEVDEAFRNKGIDNITDFILLDKVMDTIIATDSLMDNIIDFIKEIHRPDILSSFAKLLNIDYDLFRLGLKTIPLEWINDEAIRVGYLFIK